MTKPSDDKDPRKVTTNRIVLWVLVSAFAIYLIVSGLIGVFTHG
jgi:hypothetical protein